MPRLKPVDLTNIDDESKALLQGVQDKFGATTNMLRTMANSKAVLNAYLKFEAALANGTLPARLLEQIALAVAEANEGAYCLAVHTATGKAAGLSEETILDSRRGQSPDSKEEAALQAARAMVLERGWGREHDLARLRKVGYREGEIAELIANVVLNLFTNHFNNAAGTEIDFPPVEPLAALSPHNSRFHGGSGRHAEQQRRNKN